MSNLIVLSAVVALTLSVCLEGKCRDLRAPFARTEADGRRTPPAVVSLADAAAILGVTSAGPSLEALLVLSGVRAEISPDGYLLFSTADLRAIAHGDLPSASPEGAA